MDNNSKTKRFLSLPKETLAFILKASFLRIMSLSGTTRVFYRLNHVKYDECNPIFDSDVNKCHNVNIGDIVDIFGSRHGLRDGSLFWDDMPSSHPYGKTNRQITEPSIVVGFIKLKGNIIESRIGIETFFCALAPIKNLSMWISDDLYKLSESCILRAMESSMSYPRPILLFWAEGLKKIQNYVHVD